MKRGVVSRMNDYRQTLLGFFLMRSPRKREIRVLCARENRVLQL